MDFSVQLDLTFPKLQETITHYYIHPELQVVH